MEKSKAAIQIEGLFKTIRKTESQIKQMEREVKRSEKAFWDKFHDLEKRKISVDEELLKDFLAEYWFLNKKDDTTWEVIVPRWLDFSVGFLDRSTKGYNVFLINQYTQWLGELPAFLRKEVQIPEPHNIKFDGENVKFPEEDRDYVSDSFGNLLSSVDKGSARVKRGREFDLIASIIESGSLPFIPSPVDPKDLRKPEVNFELKGKYSFQMDAYKHFLKYGAIGLYYMTGAGKSFVTMYTLDSLIGQKLLVVPTLTLTEQWTEYFKEYAPRLLKEVEISTYQGYEKIKDKQYIIGVYDECHQLPANTFSRLATLPVKYRLGLSASPYRNDGRTNYIFALTGYPIGLEWKSIMKILGKHYHDVTAYIVASEQQKINMVSSLLNREKKTIIFVNELAIGHRIANSLGIPFIHGQTKNRMELARDSKVFVASRVMELGVSLKDLEHIIEVDYLFGSRREELQRTGRLFHSESAEAHDIIFTKEEFEKYGKRLHSLVEKGFHIRLKPMVSGSFEIRAHPYSSQVPKKRDKNNRATECSQIVQELFEEGFFVAERTFTQINEELARRGVPSVKHKASTIYGKLNGMVRQKKLYKVKTGKGYHFVQR